MAKNYLIRSCNGGLKSYVVNSGENTISTGSTYYFTFTGDTLPICAEVISEDAGGSINDGVSSIINYTDCNECIVDTPRSAGTEYNICEVCTDGTVITVYNLNPPHPVYTDGYGTPVTQLNMVVLGGPNGLNS